MKIGCNSCGIHFPQDFKKTLTAQCNYWGDIGMANVSVKMKKKLWKWLFKMPCDEIYVLYNLGIYFSIHAVPVPQERKFEELISGYTEMTEEEQQQAQREWYMAKKSGGGESEIDPLQLKGTNGKNKVIN